MASAQVEQMVFDAFTRICPNFAGRQVTCSPGANPPDFLCVDSAGARIGVELSEWLDEDQIARERPQYQVEEQFLEVIQSRKVQPPAQIGAIWIFENEGRRLQSNEASGFRDQLYRFARSSTQLGLPSKIMMIRRVYPSATSLAIRWSRSTSIPCCAGPRIAIRRKSVPNGSRSCRTVAHTHRNQRSRRLRRP